MKLLGAYNSVIGEGSVSIHSGSGIGDAFNTLIVKKPPRSYRNYEETIIVEHRNVGGANANASIQFNITVTRVYQKSGRMKEDMITFDIPHIFAQTFLDQLSTEAKNKKEVGHEK